MEKEQFEKKMGIEPLIVTIIGLILAGLVIVWIGMKIRDALS